MRFDQNAKQPAFLNFLVGGKIKRTDTEGREPTTYRVCTVLDKVEIKSIYLGMNPFQSYAVPEKEPIICFPSGMENESFLSVFQ